MAATINVLAAVEDPRLFRRRRRQAQPVPRRGRRRSLQARRQRLRHAVGDRRPRRRDRRSLHQRTSTDRGSLLCLIRDRLKFRTARLASRSLRLPRAHSSAGQRTACVHAQTVRRRRAIQTLPEQDHPLRRPLSARRLQRHAGADRRAESCRRPGAFLSWSRTGRAAAR